MGNNLVPDHYVNMIKKFVMFKRSFVINDVVKYCYNQTKEFDEGDRRKIRILVQKTLQDLLDFGYISKCGERYHLEKSCENTSFFIFDDIPQMKPLTKEQAQKLAEIDKSVDITYHM